VLDIDPRLGRQKAASALPPGPARGGPYGLIEDALKAGEAYAAGRAAYKEAKAAEDAARVVNVGREPQARLTDVLGGGLAEGPAGNPSGAKEGAARPFFVTGNVLGPEHGTKRASFLNSLVDPVVKGMFEKTKAKTDNGLLDSYYTKLNDPAHEQRLRQIHSEAMLNDLLANDEVISGHEPHEVIRAFNELSQLSPRLSNQPMAVRALLRRHLSQGQVDPFELDMISGIENKLKQRDEVNTANLGVLQGVQRPGGGK
jgi:hypothetical protein